MIEDAPPEALVARQTLEDTVCRAVKIEDHRLVRFMLDDSYEKQEKVRCYKGHIEFMIFEKAACVLEEAFFEKFTNEMIAHIRSCGCVDTSYLRNALIKVLNQFFVLERGEDGELIFAGVKYSGSMVRMLVEDFLDKLKQKPVSDDMMDEYIEKIKARAIKKFVIDHEAVITSINKHLAKYPEDNVVSGTAFEKSRELLVGQMELQAKSHKTTIDLVDFYLKLDKLFDQLWRFHQENHAQLH